MPAPRSAHLAAMDNALAAGPMDIGELIEIGVPMVHPGFAFRRAERLSHWRRSRIRRMRAPRRVASCRDIYLPRADPVRVGARSIVTGAILASIKRGRYIRSGSLVSLREQPERSR